MDPISITTLALSSWNLLAPYAKKLASKLVEKTDESLPDVVGKVWDVVKEKMESHPESEALLADLVQAPEDGDTQGAFKYQLRKMLENDDAFAKRLDELVMEVKSVTNYSSGKGGVHVDGNTTGSNIVPGNKNRLAGEPTIDAPPPDVNKKKG